MTASATHPTRWIAGILLLLAVLVALFIAFFDWNWLREPIARRVSSLTGRTQLGLHPLNGFLKGLPVEVALCFLFIVCHLSIFS